MLYLYDDEDIMDIIITLQNNRIQRRIYDIQNYVEYVVLSLNSESFKSHFLLVYSNIINNNFVNSLLLLRLRKYKYFEYFRQNK